MKKKTVYLYLWSISSDFYGEPIYHTTHITTIEKLKKAFSACNEDYIFNYDDFTKSGQSSVQGRYLSFGIVKLKDYGDLMDRNIKNQKIKKVWNDTCGDMGAVGKISTDYDDFSYTLSADNSDFEKFVQML